MDVRDEMTLVVETGILCNNRCVFCYEKGYRRIPDMNRLPSSEVIRSRIRWGIENGYSEVSFTGGEPTIRRDFIELVEYARELGYSHVAVTTNGSRLCDGDFFGRAVRAGLDGMGVSIHGPSSEMHDALTGRPGSFVDAVKALRNGVRTAKALGGRRFRLNSFSVLHAGILGDLSAFTGMLATLGVRLMILQPPVVGKSNVAPAPRVGLDILLDSVTQAARAAAAGGYRIKPFNIPPCMLDGEFAGIDMTMYGRTQFRENDVSDPSVHIPGEEAGFVRFDACRRCAFAGVCPGISVALLPDIDLLPAFDHVFADDGPLWLTGTEFLSASSIAGLISRAQACRVYVCTGGTHRCGVELFDAAATSGATLTLVHKPRDSSSSDRIVCAAGNDVLLLETLAAVVDCDRNPALAVCGSCDDSFMNLLTEMSKTIPRGRAVEVRVAPPWRTPGGSIDALERLIGLVTMIPGWTLVAGIESPTVDDSARLRNLAARYPDNPVFSVDNEMRVMPTAFENPLLSMLNWSVPEGVSQEGRQNETIQVTSMDVTPPRVVPPM